MSPMGHVGELEGGNFGSVALASCPPGGENSCREEAVSGHTRAALAIRRCGKSGCGCGTCPQSHRFRLSSHLLFLGCPLNKPATAQASASLLETLTRSDILEPSELEQARELIAAESDPKEAARGLMRAKLITGWQAGQLLGGRHRLRLGKYVLLDVIGNVGLGKVYLAEHQQMDRRVALKLLNREHSHSEAISRFLERVRDIAALDHPHVIQLFDVDTESERYYMVMEYVDGQPLLQQVRRDGPFTPKRAAQFILQAAEGLSAIHAKGMVHADISPANLMLDSQGEVKILNLGMAELAASVPASHADPGDSDKLAGDSIVYRSPEQLAGEAPTPRSDLFSLGATFYFLLTGKAPFADSAHLANAADAAAREAPDPTKLRPKLPAELVEMCRSLLSGSAENRPGSASDVVEKLKGWLSRQAERESLPVAAPLDEAALKKAPPAKPRGDLPESRSDRDPAPAVGPAININTGGPGSSAAGPSSGSAAPAANAGSSGGGSQIALLLGIGGLLALLLIGGGGAAAYFAFAGGDDSPDQEQREPQDPETGESPRQKTDASDDKTPKDDEDNPEEDDSTIPGIGEPAPAMPPDGPGDPEPGEGEPENPEPEDPQAEGPEPEKPKPEPTPEKPKPEPEKPKPKPEKPKPKPPAKKPLQDFASRISLPPISPQNVDEATKPVPLGKVHLRPDDLRIITLLGGDGAADKAGVSFNVTAQGGGLSQNDWDVQLKSGNQTKTIATLNLRDEQLSFSWTPEAAGDKTANYFRNCVLDIRFGGDQKKVTLRDSRTTAPYEVDLDRRGGFIENIDLDYPPAAEKLRVELTVENFPKHRFETPPPIEADGGSTLLLVGEDINVEALAFLIESKVRRGKLTLAIKPMFSLGGATQAFNAASVERAANALAVQLQQARQVSEAKAPDNLPKQLQQQFNARKQAATAAIPQIEGELAKVSALKSAYESVNGKGRIGFRVVFETPAENLVLVESDPAAAE